MSKKISFSLNPSSIEKAIAELKEYKEWVVRKTNELNERLALIGTAEAARRFGAAIYDGENDVKLSAVPIEHGWKIVAEGQAVCFIEFGAGVYHNGAEPYPNPRPAGVVGIGEYGQGKGKRQGWMFYDGDALVFTRGNPAAMPMFHASEAIKRDLEKVAKEVFSHD